jgi:EmrB/QacA subfamily drug resistance transporter
LENKQRNRLLLVLFAGVLMAALDIAIVGPALPTMRDYFGLDDRSITWLFTIYVLFHLIGTPLMAKLSDMWGRRAVYLADLILFAAGSLLVAVAPSFGLVLAGRAIQGFGSGGIFPVASAVIGDTFPPEKRGSALGLIGAVFGIAFIIGPVLGGLLLLAGWRWLFAINMPILIGLMIVAPPLLPNSRPAFRLPFDWTGMATLGIILGALTYGLNRLDTSNIWASLTSPQVWPLLVVAIVLLPAFVRLEQQAVDPVIHLRLFKSRQLRLASLLAIGGGLGESAVVFIPALAVAAFAVSKSNASFLLMPLVLALAVGAPTAGKLLDKKGSRVVILAGTSLLAVGMLGLGFFGHIWALFIAAIILIGLGLAALLGAPVRYIMLNEARPEDRTVAQGLIAILTGVGQLVSGALMGAIVTSTGGGITGYASAYGLIGATAIVMVLVSLGLKSRASELVTITQNSVTPVSTVENFGAGVTQ